MPLPTPNDPLVNGARIRQQTGLPFWQPPTVVMEIDANPVVAGQGPGWVSGSIANLADGASVTMLFDLGPDWDQYPFIQVTMASTTATSLSSIQLSSSDTATLDADRRLQAAYSTGFSTMFATITTVSGPQGVVARPMGRYLHIRAINTAGAGPQGPTSNTTVAMFAN